MQLIDEDTGFVFSNSEKFTSKDLAHYYGSFLSDVATVICIQREVKRKASPLLFSTASLQGYMSRYFSWSPDYTLEIAKRLYQKEFLTYPRTAYNIITEYEFAYLNRPEYIYQLVQLIGLKDFQKVKEEVTERYVDTDKTGEHHAIIPTDTIDISAYSRLVRDERLLYKVVAKRTLLMFEADYQYQSTKIVIDNNGQEFLTKQTNVLNSGWKKFSSRSMQEKYLPDYQEGESVLLSQTVFKDKTKAPKRLTEADLVEDVLEKKGLGTPATRASILKTILERGYVKKEKKTGQLHPLERGRLLISYLEDLGIDYIHPETTRVWEDELEKIGQGLLQEGEFISHIQDDIRFQLQKNDS